MRSSLAIALSAGAVIGIAVTPAAVSAATGGSVTARNETAFRTSAPQAAPGGDPATTVTFAVTGGALTMTAPASANLGSGTPGTTISGALGTVTVTDNRAALADYWGATVASTSFTTGGGTGPETIPASAATYTPGTITSTGTITTNGFTLALSSIARTVVAGTSGSGDNAASWNPTIGVAVPSGAIGGTYTGTLTQSVA